MQNELTSPLLVFFFLKYTQTHPHRHKKIITEIHKHTHADKPTKRQIGASVGRLWIGGLVLVALD